ncbi:retrovirus-like pol polyprotein [Lasius niger]|uniref:Retrovirus-like pol polyprotein n=1 Tax=Lasius niger TaxID=67767 RepID=A0A0J7N6D2_LASNI|nr:retrovirus-like pol polyprotein [Lasius niger]
MRPLNSKIIKQRNDEIIVYIDDILIPSDSIQENLSVLKKVLLLLKQYKFEINVNKCLFLKKEFEYLGYTLSPLGITLNVRHTKAISNFPRPKRVVEVQRFLGLTNYFRKFIKDYAKLAKPLQVLLPAILLQKQDAGQWAPISYYSQTTNKSEAQYHSYELEMLATFGNPEVVTSDRGTSFTSQEFSKFLSSRGIKHTLIAVAAPWANGIVERINRFLKSSLKKLIEDPASWHTWLGAVQYVINSTYHSSLKASSSRLLLGYDQRGHSDSKLVRFLDDLAKVEWDTESVRQNAQRLATETTNRIKAYNKDYYDSHYRKPTIYHPGDYVMIRDTNVKPGENKKFRPCYKGPYLVAKALDKNRYVIQDIPGFNVSSRPYNSILSPDRLKLWIKPVEPQVPL